MILVYSAVQRNRRGSVGPLTAILLLPLIAMLAMALDLGYIWKTEAELQNAADSAALAGCARLIDPNAQLTPDTFTGGATATILPGSSAFTALLVTARTNAVATAQQFGGFHTGAGVSLVINASDVELGFIQDPAASPSTPAGAFQTDFSVNFPNAVRVRARRDSQTSTGPFGLFFTRVFGVSTAERSETATACIRSGTINGFNGSGGGLLPIAMHVSIYENAILPPVAGVGDNFTVTIGESRPPANVTSGTGDGKKEMRIFPEPLTGTVPGALSSGNFGLLNLRRDRSSSANEIDEFIRNGLSGTDLATWGENGLVATSDAPLEMGGQTGLQATQEDALRSIIGQPRIMPVYTSTAGPGSNATFQVVGFVAVVVVDVELNGPPAGKKVVVQVTRTIEPGAVVTSSTGSGSTRNIIQGISLSR